MRLKNLILIFITLFTIMSACNSPQPSQSQSNDAQDALLNKYVQVPLTSDISHLAIMRRKC